MSEVTVHVSVEGPKLFIIFNPDWNVLVGPTDGLFYRYSEKYESLRTDKTHRDVELSENATILVASLVDYIDFELVQLDRLSMKVELPWRDPLVNTLVPVLDVLMDMASNKTLCVYAKSLESNFPCTNGYSFLYDHSLERVQVIVKELTKLTDKTPLPDQVYAVTSQMSVVPDTPVPDDVVSEKKPPSVWDLMPDTADPGLFCDDEL